MKRRIRFNPERPEARKQQSISDEVVSLLNAGNNGGEMNLYSIAKELQRNPGAISRVLKTLIKTHEVEENIMCPGCGLNINRNNTEKRYSIKIIMR